MTKWIERQTGSVGHAKQYVFVVDDLASLEVSGATRNVEAWQTISAARATQPRRGAQLAAAGVVFEGRTGRWLGRTRWPRGTSRSLAHAQCLLGWLQGHRLFLLLGNICRGPRLFGTYISGRMDVSSMDAFSCHHELFREPMGLKCSAAEQCAAQCSLASKVLHYAAQRLTLRRSFGTSTSTEPRALTQPPAGACKGTQQTATNPSSQLFSGGVVPPEGPETETGSATGTNQAGLPPPASSPHSDWLSSTQGENAAAGASRPVGQPNLR